MIDQQIEMKESGDPEILKYADDESMDDRLLRSGWERIATINPCDGDERRYVLKALEISENKARGKDVLIIPFSFALYGKSVYGRDSSYNYIQVVYMRKNSTSELHNEG